MNPRATTSVTAAPDRTRFFYAGAAAVLLAITFIGFLQFYAHGKAYPGRPIAPPIRALVVSHGIAMSAWVLLMLVQPLLVLNRQYRIHMLVGRAGAVLAAGIFVLGLLVAVHAVKVSPPELRLWGLTYKQFLAVPVISITIFTGFVAIGVWHRRRPAVHRPMMLLATLAAIPAAIDRIDAITGLYRETIWGTLFGPFFGMLVLGALFFVVKWAVTRSFDRWYAMGYATLAVASALIMQLAPTPAWDRVASALLQ
jgi:hypothetical protein